MPKRVAGNIKYTTDELEKYNNESGSCVKKETKTLHINIPPHALKDFRSSLPTIIAKRKIGTYDEDTEGIILDVHNLKLIGTSGAIRFDDPKVHVDVVGDCYFFKPVVGAIVSGKVRHVSLSQIGVIIYRVFSVSIRLVKKSKVKIEIDSDIEFKIKNFDLENYYPYIEGELVESASISSENTLKRTKISFEEIEEEENAEKQVMDVLTQIKQEEPSPKKSKTPKKRKKEVTIKKEEQSD